MNYKFTIEEHIGLLSITEDGNYSCELNRVRWNDRPVKYDLRHWNNRYDEKRAEKGITLSYDELVILKGILNDLIQ